MNDWSFLDKVWTILAKDIPELVPSLLAALLLLIVGWVVSLFLSTVAQRLLKRLGLDRWLDESGFSTFQDGRVAPSPTRVISKLVFWLFFLSFGVVALQRLGLDLSVLPIRAFVTYLPVVLGAVLLLVAGVLVASFLGRGTEAALRGMGIDNPRRMGQIVKSLVVALTVVVVVEQLGFDVTTLTRTFSNLVVVIAAGLVFAFAWGGREVARNVLAGYYIREHFEQGDRISVDGFEGELIAVGSLNSRLAAEDSEVVVPNSRLIEQTVAKKTAE